MTRVYYKAALGAFVVCDLTRQSTFEGVTKWKDDIDAKVSLPEAWGGGRIPVVLLANKSDLVSDGHGQHVNPAEMDELCEKHGFIKWQVENKMRMDCILIYATFRFETSAKDNTNIDEAAKFLIKSILDIEEQHGSPDLEEDERIQLEESNANNGGGCC